VVRRWAVIPILVEKSCSERNSLHDELQVLDALALLLESHGPTVVNVDDNIVESKSVIVSTVSLATMRLYRSPDNVDRNLSGNMPCSNKLVDLLGSALSSLLNARITRRVEALEALLLNGLL
jgi:hypothetical protein